MSVTSSTIQQSQFDFRQSLLATLWKANLAVVAIELLLVTGLPGAHPIWFALPGLWLIASLAAWQFLNQGRYGWAAWFFVGLYAVALCIPVAALSEANVHGSVWQVSWQILPFVFPLLAWITGLLLPLWSLLAVFGLQVAGTMLVPVILGNPLPPLTGGALLLTVLSGAITWLSAGPLFRAIYSAWDNYQRAEERTAQLAQSRADLRQSLEAQDVLNRQMEQINAELSQQAAQSNMSVQISQIIASEERPGELLAQIVQLLHQGFQMHVMVFLVEPESEVMVLSASSYPGSNVGLRLQIDDRTVVGWCAAHMQSRFEQEVMYQPGAGTYQIEGVRLEAAIALLSRGKLQGVLGLQSTQDVHLGDQEVSTLTSIADQIASGVANLRVLDETHRAIDDLEQLRQRYVRESWDRLAPRMRSVGYRLFGGDLQPLSYRPEPEAKQVMALSRPVIDEKNIAVPISYGGHVLGVLGIHDPGSERTWSEDAVSLVQSVADQMGQALENARLFEDAQERLAEITTLQRSLLRESWESYMSTRQDIDFVFRQPGVPELSAIPSEAAYALAQHEPLAWIKPGNGDAETSYVAPIDRRGQVIGMLGLQEVGVQREWTGEELEIINAVTEQLSSAIEVAQLFEEVQRRAVEIERVAEELREIDQFRADFLATMSHELRTPLNSIIGFSRVMLKGIDGPLNEMQQTDLEAIYNNGQNLLRLINDILDQSKIDSGKMELILENNVDIVELLIKEFSTIEIQVRQKEKSIELVRDFASDIPTIRADGARLRQVVRNLLSNADKFTEQGSITIKAWHEEDLVYVSVADTGVGMPAEKLGLVFEKFRQIDSSSTRAAEGTGLGMPISRTLVELHGGRIWVESEAGAGTTFTFYLPIGGPQAEEIPELANLVIDKTKRIVLVVESNDTEVENYRRFLESVGYQVVGLYDPEEAIRWARYLNPLAIVMDVEIGQSDRGWSLLDALRRARHTRQTPVVVCSRSSEGARAISTGASAFLRKPIVAREMIELFKQLSRK
ncbi:MAG: GAF domain-containing protein [Anaerolineae bacterium]|nr:GAF domain-containing protein [Anaerolineae bacterium]